MKKITSAYFFACLIFMFGNVLAQPNVGPAPYCMANYNMIPCNQNGPCNAPGNFINDFINSFNTTGAITNITNNNSCCNSQVIPGMGQRNYRLWGCEHYLVVNPGQVITCNFQSGNTFPQGFALFVDWNQDNVFNVPAERLIGTPVPPAGVFTSGMFTVPAGQAPGTYRMRVRCIYWQNGNFIDPCNNTTYGECEDYFLYVAPAQPAGAITATVTSNSPICAGTTANFSVATSYTGALTYTWTGPNGFNSNMQNPSIPNAQPMVSGIYTVVISPGACPITKTVQLEVNPNPTVNPSNNGPICQGSQLNLTANVLGGGTPAYNWTGPNGFTSNLQNPSIPNAQPANAGTYSITVVSTFTNGGTCQSGNSTTAAVVPVNQVSVTPSFTLCQGSQLNLTANNAVPPNGYSWTGPAGFTSQQQNPSIPNILPPSSGDYIVTASFAVQGVTLVCTTTAVTNVSVVATSPLTVTMPANICQYSTAALAVSSSPMAQDYSWTGPNGFTANGTNTTIANIQPVSSGLYNVVATWAIGSVSCTINGANQINVVPVPDINVNAPVSVCYPGNVQLSATSPGAISYNWTSTSGYTSNIANPLLASPEPSLSGIYTINTAYTNGALTCFNSNTTQVTVNPILVFSLPEYEQKCFNSTYTVAGPAGATSYTWQGPNGYTSNNQNLVIPNVTATHGGVYTLTVNLGPCPTSSSTKVDILSPIAYSSTPGNKVICAGESVTLTMGATGGSHNYAYTWDPAIYLTSPTGSVQHSTPLGTTIYNVAAYDVACPFYTIHTTFTVTVNKPPVPDLKLEKTEGCEPLCFVYNSRTQKEAETITYDFGNGSLVQADSFQHCLSHGTYNLMIKTRGKNGCSGVYTHPAPIVVWPKPHSDMTWEPEQPSTTNNQITFWPNNQFGPISEYYWQFVGATSNSGYDTSSAKSPLRIYENVGKYPVMLISKTDKGCVDTVFKVLDIREEFTVFIPNSFTPNGDGLNDVFNIKGLGLKNEGYSMEIFDRWGTLVYTTKDAYKGWDGTIKGLNAVNGTYVYKVKAIGANGEGRKEYVGHVTLMR